MKILTDKEYKELPVKMNELIDSYQEVVRLISVSGYQICELVEMFREGYVLMKPGEQKSTLLEVSLSFDAEEVKKVVERVIKEQEEKNAPERKESNQEAEGIHKPYKPERGELACESRG